MVDPQLTESPLTTMQVSAPGGARQATLPSPCHMAVSPAEPHQHPPPLDGAGILVQPPHALQGSRIRKQVRGEAGVFQHEEHVNQLFEGALGRPGQGEGLGWPGPPSRGPSLQPQSQARKGPLVGNRELSRQMAHLTLCVAEMLAQW